MAVSSWDLNSPWISFKIVFIPEKKGNIRFSLKQIKIYKKVKFKGKIYKNVAKYAKNMHFLQNMKFSFLPRLSLISVLV